MPIYKCPKCGCDIQEIEYQNSVEIASYPTISCLRDTDKGRYEKRSGSKRKATCPICDIEYDKNKYSTCPMCELKKTNKILTQRLTEMTKTETQGLDHSKQRGSYMKGDIVRFGSYAGKTVEWIVLKADKDKVLLLSKYVLDVIPYNSVHRAVTWKASSLRQYLNHGFIEDVFSALERKQIENVNVDNRNNGKHNRTYGGEDTYDRIFCLSIDETEQYIENDIKKRMAEATEFAKSRVNESFVKFFINDKTNSASWWLRSPGFDSKLASCVDGTGWINAGGFKVNDSSVGIRPALWMKV